MRVVFLWLHVLSGVAWVGACACFFLAASALSTEPDEVYALALRTAPLINRICAPLVFVIPLTGIGNLVFAARAHRFELPPQFVGILSAKIALFSAMTFALWRARRAAQMINAKTAGSGDALTAIRLNIRELVNLYGLILGAGIAALALGFWLSGI